MYEVRTRSGSGLAIVDDFLLALRVLRLCSSERREPLTLFRTEDNVKLAYTTAGLKASETE